MDSGHGGDREMKKQLGAVIRQFRVRRGLSQGQLSQAVGISASQISNIERGDALPSLETLFRISRALETDLVEIFRFDSKRFSANSVAADSRVIKFFNALPPEDRQLAIDVLRLMRSRSRRRS